MARVIVVDACTSVIRAIYGAISIMEAQCVQTLARTLEMSANVHEV